MPHFQIKCRLTGSVRFEGKFGSLRLCVEAAVKAGANLAGANFSGADLRGTNLSGAYLAGANLAGADLAGANLARANFSGADLRGTNLSGAYLRGTKLGKRGLLKEVTRSDGYRFILFDCEDGSVRVLAGCRWFTLPEAWRHWETTRTGTPLGEETFDILVLFEHHVERLAKRDAS